MISSKITVRSTWLIVQFFLPGYLYCPIRFLKEVWKGDKEVRLLVSIAIESWRHIEIECAKIRGTKSQSYLWQGIRQISRIREFLPRLRQKLSPSLRLFLGYIFFSIPWVLQKIIGKSSWKEIDKRRKSARRDYSNQRWYALTFGECCLWIK